MNIWQDIRKGLDLSQAELAQALSLHQSTISRWERGELEPSYSELVGMRRLVEDKGQKWPDVLNGEVT